MSPTSTAASPWKTLLPVFAACAAIGLQAGVALPLVPLALQRQGVDKFTIGLVSAGWALGMLSFGTRIPRLAARFGAAPSIVFAVAVGSLIMVAFTVTSGPVAWFVLSFLHGVVGGVPWVVSEIWMNVVVEERRRGRAMAVYAAMFALGMALGPFVLQIVGVYGPRPFLTCAALALLVAVPLLPFWNTSPRIAHARDSGFGLVIAAAPLAMFAAFAAGTGEQVAFSFLPVYAVNAGVTAEIGTLWLSAFVIGNIVLQWPIGWLADHADRRIVLAACALLSMGLMLLLPLVPAYSASVIAVVMLWGGISFSIYPVGLALLGRRFNGGDIARANTAYSMLYILGGLIGRPLTGAAMDAVGEPGLGWTLALFYAAVGFAALLASRRPG
ncbi:Predicted arabinose efflux permease, MFS family [Enhydrobacter aerosaccus]|uniref:Predicted arabinose efflux permease, MFS family n=1 Tax=Enhydrobacter aerosaccus TaxID=225324 RepID=A0A1T4T432_9HYPH|nr:MFS transporter [Enhydrobacter aerosaccus]SKA35265.1 Predicted arabinose efflux permease, MFS family [Enhydrobacter aerosaccus]